MACAGGEPSLSLPDRFKRALEACDSISLRRDTTPVVSELNAWKELSPGLASPPPVASSSAQFLAAHGDGGAPPCCAFAPLAPPVVQSQVPQDVCSASAPAGFYQVSACHDPAAPRRSSWWLWAAIISLIVAAVGIFLKGKLFSFFSRRKKARTDAEEEDPYPSELPYARRISGARAETPRLPPSFKPGVLPQALCRSLPQKDEPIIADSRRPVPPTQAMPRQAQAATQKKNHRTSEGRPAAAPVKKVVFRQEPPTPEEVSDYEEDEQGLATRPAASSSATPPPPPDADPNFEEF